MKKIIYTLFLLAPSIASAQADYYGINDFSNDGANLGTKEVRNIVYGIINIALGFLAIIATLVILLGGYRMLTSGGDADKTQAARSQIVGGIIGLLIILAAYIISRFILSSLQGQIL